MQSSGRHNYESTHTAHCLVAETNQLAYLAKGSPATGTPCPGKVNKLIVTNVGTTMTVDLYDNLDSGANANPIYRYVTAEGKVNIDLNVPFQNGLRCVVGGTPGEVEVVFTV